MLITCTKCKQEKDISCFAKDRQKKHGVRRECKKCMSLRTRKHWPERLNWQDKRCAGCKKVKKKVEFHKDSTKKDGLYSICKSCRAARSGAKMRSGDTWLHDAYGYLVRGVNGKHIKQHRMIMENILKRKLEPGEHVHHKNGIKDDNRPENLQIMSHSDHASLHARRNGEKRKNGMVKTCATCGKRKYYSASEFSGKSCGKIYQCRKCYFKSGGAAGRKLLYESKAIETQGE